MSNKKYKVIFDKWFWGIYLAVGLLVFVVALGVSGQKDLRRTESQFQETMTFIKEQSASYARYNDTTTAKALRQMVLSVHHIIEQPGLNTEQELKAEVKDQWLTGISVLDANGGLVCEYTENGIGYEQFKYAMGGTLLPGLLDYPQKTYTERIKMKDGAVVDMAAHRLEDAERVLLAYRYTSADVAQRDELSIQTVLDGYPVETNGILFITQGDVIIASNDLSLVGKDVSNDAVVLGIRKKEKANTLSHVSSWETSGFYFGMYSHGRDFYVYAYLPERTVFHNTPPLVAAIMVLYLVLVSVAQMLRWWSAKAIEDQKDAQEREYKRQLEEQNHRLELAVQREAAANRSKREFLFNMSHDIRTPMNAIIGFTSLAATHADNKEQLLDYLKKISISSQHLLSLINDVLDMSRIESGKVKIEEKPVHLPDLVHDVRSIIQPNITAKRLALFIDTMDVMDEDIITDSLRLNQILLNILSNAIKFTPTGGMISIRIVQKNGAPTGYASYEFHIKDSGIGMSKEFQKHIFEEFSREESSTVSGIQGTGLGMSITKSIVDMMGGSIDIDSEPGKGSEFIVHLQFRLSGKKVEQKKLPQLEGLRALIADDDTNTCLNVSTMLTKIGMRPEWTISGREAVIRTKYAVEQGDEFSVYIIDWLIPDMNGIEIVRQIRKVIGDSTPIIILTAYDWADIEEEARAAGVTAFCEKPLFLSELREVLAQPFHVEEPETPTLPEMPSFKGKRVLLVEDNELNREIAAEILSEEGFVIDTANDGSVAVQKVEQAIPGQYDLVLMDIQMPIMDGYEATKRIRALSDPAKANIPILAMTANAFEEDRQNALNAGMNGHIAKPLDIPHLLAVLAEVLK